MFVHVRLAEATLRALQHFCESRPTLRCSDVAYGGSCSPLALLRVTPRRRRPPTGQPRGPAVRTCRAPQKSTFRIRKVLRGASEICGPQVPGVARPRDHWMGPRVGGPWGPVAGSGG